MMQDGALSPSVAPDPEVGDRVGRYTLIKPLGQGSAGSVFLARAEGETDPVALKVLAAERAVRARIVQRFFDEVRAARAAQHPGLVKVLDFIEEENPRRLAYAMEYVPGEVLRTRLERQGTLDLRTTLALGRQTCSALSALHGAGIIHRDLKPENLLLGPRGSTGFPMVKLFDFGVVKFLPARDLEARNRAAAAPGTFVGTPRYMAPEQAAGTALDQRADIFALGVMLFEMTTGRRPHDGDDLRSVVMAKLDGAPKIRVNALQEAVPEALTNIVDRCLQLRASQRPKDAQEVELALQEAERALGAARRAAIRAARPFRAPVRSNGASSFYARPPEPGASSAPKRGGAARSSERAEASRLPSPKRGTAEPLPSGARTAANASLPATGRFRRGVWVLAAVMTTIGTAVALRQCTQSVRVVVRRPQATLGITRTASVSASIPGSFR